jgi:4-hydroxy-2-oxoheptanedioate aldolase
MAPTGSAPTVSEPERSTLRLGAGQPPALGIFVAEASPALAESLSSSFDFLVVDLEHGALDLGEVQRLLTAAQSAGAVWARVPSVVSDRLAPVLDAGIDGIIAPSVESAEQAAELAARLRYPPAGRRGLGLRRAGSYGRTKQFWNTPEAEVGCVVQIETARGVAEVASIVGTDGVDGVLVGCSDLSMSLGSPGVLDSVELAEAVAAVESATRSAGLAFGIAGGGADPADLLALASAPLDFFLYSVDTRVYAEAVDAVAQRARSALRGDGTGS